MKKGNRNALLSLCVVVCICIVCFVVYMSLKEDEKVDEISLDTLPEYSQNAYVMINNNEPDFEEYEITEAQTSFETYNQLDFSRIQDRNLWYAAYQDKPAMQDRFMIWQYSHTGTLPGISTHVDMNIMPVKK